MFSIAVILGVFAIVALLLYRVLKSTGWIIVAAVFAVLVLVFTSIGVYDAVADDSTTTEQSEQPTDQVEGLECPDNPVVAETPDYGLTMTGVQRFAASGGSLVGNGPALDTSSANAAVTQSLDFAAKSPMWMAQLAVGARISGFQPADSTPADPKITAEYVNSKAAQLAQDSILWSQTLQKACQKLGLAVFDPTPYKDSPLLELAVRVQDTNAEGITLPVTNVLLNRTTQPDGVVLLWIDREVDPSGERGNGFPLAIDTQFNWVAAVTAIPENAEDCLPPEEQPVNENQQAAAAAEQQKQQGASGTSDQGSATSDGGGSSGGSGGSGDGGCGDCNGGGDSGGGGGGDDCTECGGPTTTQPGGTTTTRPPTTSTTRPPTTTTRPPTTSTTRPPTTTKAPDPGCDVPGFCD